MLLHLPKGEYSMYQWARYTNIFKLPPGVKYLVTHLLSVLFLAQFPSQKKNRGKKHAYGIVMLCLFSHFNSGTSSTTFINLGTKDVQAEGIQSPLTFNLLTKKNYQNDRKEKA